MIMSDNDGHPDFAQAGFEAPSHIHNYRDRKGKLIGCVARWDLSAGGKSIRPFLRRTAGNGNSDWKMKWLKAESPLYQLDKLDHTVRTVVLVEGEKCADALNKIGLEATLEMTWQGGCKAILKTDFSPLNGYQVILWPDNDTPGFQAMQKSTELVNQAGGLVTGVVAPPTDKPAKWDAADAIREGEDIRALLSDLKPVEYLHNALLHNGGEMDHREEFSAIPHPYVLNSEGLFILTDGGSTTDELEKISSYCHVKALTRSADGDSNWGHYVEFHDIDGGSHTYAIPSALFTSTRTGEVISQLRDRGLHLVPGRKAEQQLCHYIIASKPEIRMTSVDQVGWHGGILILPDTTIGTDTHSTEQVIFQSEYRAENPFSCAGSLADWKEHIGRYCLGNTALTFAVSAAFAGPLLKLVNREAGGFHFYGPSSIGKTTLLAAAGSVCGISGPGGFIESWRATSNGLEGLAALHNDNLLCLDEISQIDPRELSDSAYMLANGQAKRRAQKSGVSRKPLTWRIVFLSTGEIRIAHRIQEDYGKKALAGQRVRIADIMCGQGRFGVFDDLHDCSSPAQLADQLKTAAVKFYGTPLREFLRRLVAERSQCPDRVEEICTSFKDRCSTNWDGQVIRVSDRFALVAAAGELAIEWGILPLEPGMAVDAARILFDQWIDDWGGTTSHESRSGIEQVRTFLETQRSRFGDANGKNARNITNLAGGVLYDQKGAVEEFRIYPTIFREDICEGLDYHMVVNALDSKGYLIKQDPDKLLKVVNFNGASKKMYVIRGTILEG